MSKAMKILIGPSTFAENNKAPLQQLQSAGYEVIDNPYKRKLTKEELFSLLQNDVIGLIAGLEPLDREVLSKSSLKVVSRVGSGVSNVDQVAAKELGIKVYTTPNGPTESVAELTLGMMLSMLRLAPQMDQALHRKEWTKKNGFELFGKNVALIGYGRIGRRVAELLEPFKVNLLVVDPFVSDPLPENCRLMNLDEALKLADIVTLHSSGEDCLIGKEQFENMKQGVFLCNVARGGLVDENMLIKNLESGKVAGAWFDTFPNEPYTGPLCSFQNVILTPHVGSYTMECRLGMETEAVENLLGVIGICK